jgi:serine/threonine protein kinase
VKPANIIVDAQGRVKLVDFGLAKALLSTTSALRAGTAGQTSAAGTAGYTPLEQWALAAEARSDVYALGATLHHLLTGREPEDGESVRARGYPVPDPLADVVDAALAGDLRTPAEMRRRLSAARRRMPLSG